MTFQHPCCISWWGESVSWCLAQFWRRSWCHVRLIHFGTGIHSHYLWWSRLSGFRCMHNSSGDRTYTWYMLHLLETCEFIFELAQSVAFRSPIELSVNALSVLLMLELHHSSIPVSDWDTYVYKKKSVIGYKQTLICIYKCWMRRTFSPSRQQSLDLGENHNYSWSTWSHQIHTVLYIWGWTASQLRPSVICVSFERHAQQGFFFFPMAAF